MQKAALNKIIADQTEIWVLPSMGFKVSQLKVGAEL